MVSIKKVLIIGGGPNRIGQGIEFDYCCVHASFALKDLGIKTIMHNCNPETVSTDYDISDTLYFEPITMEYLRAIIDREKPDGTIVHFGGQTPLKLAKSLSSIGANIIGTSPRVIDLAEDREKFSKFALENGFKQPENGSATSKEEAYDIANKITYPVLVRPSYVLGGRAMRIVYNKLELKNYMSQAISVSHNSPVLIDKFLARAVEIDVDALSDGKDVYIGGIMQHIEEAGIHSGDSASSLPPISVKPEILKEIEKQTKDIALKLNVIGLLNIQYVIHENELYVIEVNPRASRSVPFVSKTTGIPLAKLATVVMVGKSIKEAVDMYDKNNIVYEENGVFKPKTKDHIAVKESVFPFKTLGASIDLGPEMKSTGEVMGISDSFALSYAKSQLASKNSLPTGGQILLSFADVDKPHSLLIIEGLKELDFEIYSTLGTNTFYKENGIETKLAFKINEGRPNIIDMLTNNQFSLVMNTIDDVDSKTDSLKIKKAVIKNNIPYITTISAGLASIEAMKYLKNNSSFNVHSIQEYEKNMRTHHKN
jgi:carbamoyl-phosphate synthase large subunit